MATDQKISQLTKNPSITGTEELATERGGSNYKNTYTDLKTWVLNGFVSGIETVTGDGVDNTDPLNPVLSFPTPEDIGAEPIEPTIDDLAAERNDLIQTEIDNYNARLLDLNITKSGYEALTEYENRNYILDDGSIYDIAVKTQDYNYIFGANDVLVSTTGSNTTGDGSELNPYASWEYAILQTSLNGGFTIWIESGMYSMNSGGQGFASVARDWVNPVSIKSKPNESVVLTHSVGNNAIKATGTNNNWIFEGLTFLPITGTDRFFYSTSTANTSNFAIIDCIFNNGDNLSFSVLFNHSGLNINQKVKRCTFDDGLGISTAFFSNVTNVDYIGNIYENNNNSTVKSCNIAVNSEGIFNINNNSLISTSQVYTVGNTNVMIQMEQPLIANSTVNMNKNYGETDGKVLYCRGNANFYNVDLNVLGNIMNTPNSIAPIYTTLGISSGRVMYNTVSSANLSLGFPEEGPVLLGKEVTVEIAFNNISSLDHGILIGENGKNVNIHNNISNALQGVYSFVIKGNGHLLSKNIGYGGSNTCVLYKNAENCVSSDEIYIQSVGSGSAIRFSSGDVFASKNNSITKSKIKVTGGELIKGLDGANLGDGNFVDSNQYEVTGNGNWGVIYDVVNSLQELRRAWRVNVTGSQNNDLNSTDV